MKPCKPHVWKIPESTDTGLTCNECGRYLDFYLDMTVNIRTSISNSVQVRRGDAYHHRFMAAWNKAETMALSDTDRLSRLQAEKYPERPPASKPAVMVEKPATLPRRKRRFTY